MNLRTLKDCNVSQKIVLMRVDYNVSLGKTLRIVDDARIIHTIPTINYLLDHGVKQIRLLAHLGKPEGVYKKELSLLPVAEHLSELLGQEVAFVKTPQEMYAEDDKIVLLENLRFDSREESADYEYAKELAQGSDIFVNEGFGVSHRATTTTTIIPELLPSYAGFGLVEEVNTILDSIKSPKRPLVVVVGGAKVKDKIGLLQVLSKKADTILVGGGMANTFLAATGIDIADSLVEQDKYELARELLAGKYGSAKFILPIDFIKDGTMIKDIGAETIRLFSKFIKEAGTIIWNGPLGVFEDERFSVGTDAIYKELTDNEPAFVIVGGGDTLTAIKGHEALSRIDFISTGGGAMLELIEKGTLPGLQPLLQ